ncbi:MAG: thiol-disulfide oxidoreductase DCC family protein [Flavobacteriaceae bacterium]|nr:thiol-disulfide oxidoreductase DCC family protein [Flavobacteriaceae bacterium]
MHIEIPKHKKLILFDGVCNLCNNTVQYVIQRDHKNKYLFASLQSKVGKQIIEAFNIDTTKTDSILLYSNGQLYSKSTAALKVAATLGFPTNVLAISLIIPAFIRNVVYDYIAKNRYKWYGKKKDCMIPSPELKSKFIDL